MKFFFINLFFLVLSFISFLISFFKKKKECIYFIVFKGKNVKSIIDPRSGIYCNEKKIKNSICFIRCFNIKSASILFFKYQNIFIINSIEYFFPEKKSKLIFKKILISCKIKSFFMLDDYRYLNIFLPICKNLRILSHGYMHGRFSKNLKYQKSLFQHNFDYYYVWSNFFKKKILKLNSNYKPKDIIVLKKFKSMFYFKNMTTKNCKNILFLQEKEISINFLIFIIKKNKFNEHCNLYYKVRPNNKITDLQKIKLKKNNVVVLDNGNLKKDIINYKINFVYGSNSSFLYIAPLLNLIPISLDDNKLLKDLKNEQVVFFINPGIKNINNQLNLLLNSKSQLMKLKKRIWN